jgi:peroxiredoxin
MKHILFFCSLFISYASFCQYKAVLNATAPITFNNKTIFLTVEDNYSTHRYQKVDSTIIVDGRFFFANIELIYPCEAAKISIKDKDFTHWFEFTLDTGINTMHVKDVIKSSNFYKNKLSNTILTNSKSNHLKRQLDLLTNAYYKLYGKKIDGYPGVTVLDLKKKIKLNEEQLKILTKNSDNFYSLIFLYQLSYSRLSPQDIFNSYNKLDSGIKYSELGMQLYNKKVGELTAINSTQFGKPVPLFQIKNQKDSLIDTKKLAGKPYIIAFSATWCMPCKENQPKLFALYNKYKKNELELLYFNLDDDVDKWKQHIEKDNLSWINVSERTKWADSKISKQFHVESIPYYVLINRNGTIEYTTHQVDRTLENKIIELVR